ncbi:TPA: hypothetical protein I7185_01465 [Vibrio vulnificus]|nr:hypothetical protein [Vibrio vulnificus]
MSQELVNSVNKLTDETSALLQEYVKGNTVLQNSASEAASSAAAAKTSEGITIDKANVATQRAAEAKQFRDETAAVATGGTATLDPTPGKIPLANAEAKLHAGWLPVNVSALSEAIVEAIRNVNKGQYAASGFIHDGKHFNSGNLSSVNEGMTVDIGTPNVIYLGARDGVTGGNVGGASKTSYPVMNVAGFEVHLLGINSTLTNWQANTIKLPVEPNGTVVSDSSGNCRGSGKPTLDLSKEVDPKYGDVASSVNEAVARAFEGMIKNGDFRKGNSDWNQSLLTVNQGKASISGTNNNLGIGNNSAFQCIAGKEYEVEVVCEEWRSGNISFANNSLVHRPLIVDGAGVFKARFSASSSDPRYFFWLSNADMDITSFSFKPVTEEVVINRVDMAGLEFFKRKVGEYLYPYGSPQCGYAEVDGIPTTEDTSRPITYFAAYDSDTTSRGRGWRLVDLTFAQLAVIMSNPKHNAWYNEKGELLQFGPRQRSFAGVGNGDWETIDSNFNNAWSALRFYGSTSYAIAQGDRDSLPDGSLSINSNGLLVGTLATGWNKQDHLKQVGAFVAQAKDGQNIFPHAVDGECYFYVLATVPRLNQGAYHPSFNPMGTAKLWKAASDSAPAFWYESTVPISTTKDCFGQYKRSGTGNITDGHSGHPEGKLFDAIYASGQGGVIDWRLPARDMSGKEEAAKILQKLVSGTYRGLEKLSRSKTFVTTHRDAVKQEQGTLVYIDGALTFLSNGVHKTDGLYPNLKCNGYTLAQVGTDSNGDYVYIHNLEGDVAAEFPLGTAVILTTNETDISVSGNFTALDVVGPPERILATPDLANGWIGGFCRVIPDNTGKTFPASKKYLAVLGREFTTDEGSTWQRVPDWTGQGANTTLNAIATTALPPDRVTLNHYRSFANQTKRSANKPVLNGSDGIGDVWATSGYGRDIDWGVLLQESLTGKVGVSDKTDDLAYRFALTRFSIHSASLIIDNSVGRRASHNPLTLTAPTNNSPAVKALWHQASSNQQATLNFLWNELIFDTNWRTPDKVWSGGSVSVAAGETFRAESSSAYAVAGLLLRCVKAVTANATVLGAMHVTVGGDVISLSDGQTYFKVVNNGWGDDSTIRIINGVGTFNNENGDTCLYGISELAMPYGYTKKQSGAGKQVVGVDL